MTVSCRRKREIAELDRQLGELDREIRRLWCEDEASRRLAETMTATINR